LPLSESFAIFFVQLEGEVLSVVIFVKGRCRLPLSWSVDNKTQVRLQAFR
jgi:hypothetical protein